MPTAIQPGSTKRATHYKATRCLLCGSGDLSLVLPLAHSAVGNDYLRTRQQQDKFALSLHLCGECGNVQIEDIVNPDLLFREYTYSTTSSLGLVEHFRKYAAEIAAQVGLTGGSLVADIGSNDGSLLKAFAERGCRVVGVDPAVEIAARATAEGVPTVPEYFTPEVAQRVRDEHGAAKLITANNVFAHSDQLPAMADAVRQLLDADGLFTFEVSYLFDIVQKMLFDTVYHEHLCYHSVRSLRSFFAVHGLQLIDARRIPTKGGSLRGTVQLAGGPRSVSPEVGRLIEWESIVRLHSPETFRTYARRIEVAKEQFGSILDHCRATGKVIAGYGASPTVTTLIDQFHLANRLDFLVDDNPVKQNTFSPGHHLPVYPSEALYEREADVIAVLAWQYAAPITAKHRRFAEASGRFVVPLPQLQVV
ncbi:MAG: class I SAM-dependent methyltransferase [Planctomycetes bacterium]|nr:class I SAM-dependent methyltransferase [Planctomycetota bacterium]